jgi:uncharacterized membrane protein
MEILLIATFSWVLVKAVEIFEDIFLDRFQISKEDNYRERKMLTQLQFVRRLIIIVIVVIAVSLILMSFTTVRRIGLVSLLLRVYWALLSVSPPNAPLPTCWLVSKLLLPSPFG